MGLLGPHHQLLLGPIPAGCLGVLGRLVSFLRTRTSTEGTLPGAFAFSAGTGARSHRANGSCAATSMAEAGAEAEWADVRA